MAQRRAELAALRERAGVSQYEVAEALGIPRSTYGQIELGERPLRIELAARLATLFNCTIDAIFYGSIGPVSGPSESEEVKPSA